MLIDALDEGQEDDIRHMLSYLECLAKYAVSASASLRICLSSRHYPRITVKKALSVIVEHEAGHKKDVQEYVMEGLRGIDDRQTLVLQTEVLKRSSGIFLWVVLVVQLLNTMCDRGEPSAVILKEVRSIPKDLHDLFAKLLKSSNKEPEACMTVLRWVMFSGRPLRPIELYLAIRQAHAPQEEWSEAQCVDRTTATTYVLNCSRGLIEVSGSGVGRTRPTAKLQFIHESVRDYLMAADVLTAHDLVREPPTSMSREALCHAAIAEICLQYLSHFCRTASRIDEKDMGKRYPLVDYASHYCWQHLQKSRSAHSQNLLELSWSILTVEDVRKRRIVQAEYMASAAHLRSQWYTEQRLTLALCFAAMMGLPALVSHGLKYMTNVDSSSQHLEHALHIASYQGHSEVVETLIQHGANVNGPKSCRGGPLIEAVHQGHLQVVTMLVERGADVNARGGAYHNALIAASRNHGTALQAAARRGYRDVVEMLINKRADVNAQGGEYGTALQAASSKGLRDVVQILIDNGAQVNAHGGMFGNALQAASCENHPVVVEMLIDNGADVNALVRREYHNPLTAAVALGSYDVVKLLLSAGADPNAGLQGSSGNTLLKAWRRSQKFSYYERLVDVLLDAGADPFLVEDFCVRLNLRLHALHRRLISGIALVPYNAVE
ncbi:hypothetical protein PMZ80_004300 [Knufia obscura]|uniref:Ankyrin repeat protein n=1 Tax=Knufia obscura TaxID=1635080 RepID=A0ABR0RSR6_9EURO|nr:hypothetical protein PMZ80_004300 [Knufia obscura]